MHQFVVFSSGNSWNELKEMKTKIKKKKTNKQTKRRIRENLFVEIQT